MKIVGIFFGCYWCPASRNFSKILTEFYNEINIDEKQFELIYSPLDRTEEQFTNSYSEMPWLSLHFGDERVAALKKRYEILSIPSMIILDVETGKSISIRGRKDVQDLDAWPLWKKRREAEEFCFEVPFHSVSHTITEEAKLGQIEYNKWKQEEFERKEKERIKLETRDKKL